MHLPEIDKYAYLRSTIHSWEPRIKIVSLALLMIAVVLINNLPGAVLALLFAVGLVLISRIPLPFVFKHLRWVVLFCMVLFVIMSLTASGNNERVLLICLRAVTVVLLIFPMIATVEFNVTLQSLQRLKVPHLLVQLLLFSYRYIFVLMDELQRMLQAAQARGFKKGINKYKLKIIGSIIGMLFVRSFERTERIYNAMIARGYTGKIKTIDDTRIQYLDILKSGLVIVMIGIVYLV